MCEARFWIGNELDLNIMKDNFNLYLDKSEPKQLVIEWYNMHFKCNENKINNWEAVYKNLIFKAIHRIGGKWAGRCWWLRDQVRWGRHVPLRDKKGGGSGENHLTERWRAGYIWETGQEKSMTGSEGGTRVSRKTEFSWQSRWCSLIALPSFKDKESSDEDTFTTGANWKKTVLRAGDNRITDPSISLLLWPEVILGAVDKAKSAEC